MTESSKGFVPVAGQSFATFADWVWTAEKALTAHPEYLDTERGGSATDWRGHHFKALCFDQKGRLCRSGGEFMRARDEDAFPVWWVWPDQVAALVSRVEEQGRRADGAEMALWRVPPSTHTLSDGPGDAFEGPGETWEDAYRRVVAERDALAAFKAFVHRRLDESGVEKNPDGPHSKEGCRIGDRLDIVLASEWKVLNPPGTDYHVAPDFAAEQSYAVHLLYDAMEREPGEHAEHLLVFGEYVKGVMTLDVLKDTLNEGDDGGE